MMELSDEDKERGCVMNFQMFAWLIGMWIVGSLIYNFIGMQISITKRCALKLYSMVCDDTEYWYADSCRKYFKKVIRADTILILFISFLVLQFIPLIGAIGFFAGYFLKLLSTRRATGVTDPNIDECIKIFLRFAKPGKELEFEGNLYMAAHKLKTDEIFCL